jgi:hypothetical protein
VTISGPGRTLKPEMVLKAGETKTIDIPAATGEPSGAAPAPSGAEKEAGGSKALPIALLGLGAAAIVVGSVTGLMVLAKKSDLDDRCGSDKSVAGVIECPKYPQGRIPQDMQDDYDSTKSLSVVSTLSFVFGGIAAAAGVTLLVLPSSSSSTAAASAGRTKLVPTAGPGGGGMTFVGTF